MNIPNIALPSLYCPFPPILNSHAAIVDQGTINWARQFQLITTEAVYQKFRAARFGWLTAYLSPTSHRTGLQLLSDWNTWAIIWDDCCDQMRLSCQPELLASQHTIFFNILSNTETSRYDESLHRGLRNLHQRIQQNANPAQMDWFIRTVKDFFTGCVWEVHNRAKKTYPDINTYTEIRRLTSAMDTSLALAEIIEGVNLPPEIRRRSDVQYLRCMAIDSVCCANDLLSLAKELSLGEIHNLVLLIQHEHTLDLQEAVNYVASLHNAQVQASLSAEQHRPPLISPTEYDLQRYITLLRYFMYGNIAWSSTSGRYQTLERSIEAISA